MSFSPRSRLIHPLSFAVCLSLILGTGTTTIAQPQLKQASSKQGSLATTQSKKAMDWWVPGILGTSVAIVGVGAAIFLRRSQQPLPQPSEAIPASPQLAPIPTVPTTQIISTVESPSPEARKGSEKGSEKRGDRTPSLLPRQTVQATTLPEQTPQPKSPEAVPTSSSETIVPTVRMPRPSIMDSLVTNLRSNDPEKRQKAIWELGQRGDSRAVQPLVDLLLNSDSKQRSLVLSSLSEISTRTLKPVSKALALSMQDQNPEVRKNAIRDLTKVYDMLNHVSQLLQHACEDPDAEVQETAKWAIGQINRIKAPLIESNSNRAMSQPERLN